MKSKILIIVCISLLLFSMALADNGQGVSEVGSLSSVTTGIDNEGIVVNKFTLFNAYPNPFNPLTTIKFYLPAAGEVSLNVFNAMGQKMVNLVKGKQSSGYHTVVLDGTALSSGIYYYQLNSGKNRLVKKVLLIK